MNLSAIIANFLWSAANLPSYFQFRRALQDPERAQQQRLRAYLDPNRHTAFGEVHKFASIRTYDEFAHRVPLMDYESLKPWIERICRGESNVLTRDSVTRLVPTSGSSGGRKLIPFTAGLLQEFNAAIDQWLVDLLRHSPGIAAGPAYWSVTPVVSNAKAQASAVPIGFDTDTAYLGGSRQRLARAVMAVPDESRSIQDLEVFRYVTLLCLLRQREMRLISVWHPSFLTLLLDSLPGYWRDLQADIRSGGCKHADRLPPVVRDCLELPPLPHRAEELGRIDLQKPETIWPHLKLLSCWGDGAATVAANSLKELFPNTTVQPKGLLATEACVTIPFVGQHPIAVRSHFFEFEDEAGKIRRVHELELGQKYEVIVTTSGGLWRYRLRDCVQVTDFIGRTPSLRFLGRSGNVSDLFGEKLSEAFVAQALQEVLVAMDTRLSFALLAPDNDTQGYRYTLYAEGKLPESFAATFDQALRLNPHYAYCRDLGQLLPVRLFVITKCGYQTFINQKIGSGARLGDVKPMILSRTRGWSTIFEGAYVQPR
ncbi:MAG: GH3 auxin-responsive promoter family protein [Verrucomicrobia subdivision 3 bacterium]|nr:GH3 auxin-responsive promoter family protein [Limisphaerales bacterium]